MVLALLSENNLTPLAVTLVVLQVLIKSFINLITSVFDNNVNGSLATNFLRFSETSLVNVKFFELVDASGLS